jgi:hypothetical protein
MLYARMALTAWEIIARGLTSKKQCDARENGKIESCEWYSNLDIFYATDKGNTGFLTRVHTASSVKVFIYEGEGNLQAQNNIKRFKFVFTFRETSIEKTNDSNMQKILHIACRVLISYERFDFECLQGVTGAKISNKFSSRTVSVCAAMCWKLFAIAYDASLCGYITRIRKT